MQRIINEPDQVVEDMLKGFVHVHRDYVQPTENSRVLCAAASLAPNTNRVGIVTGGGAGHKPAFIGYIGKNLLDAVAVGEIFSSPTAAAFLAAFRSADKGQGVACLYGNYAGDNMNVKMAIKMAAKEGIEVQTVVANDDIASAAMEEREKRRGVAGEVLMWKVGGAKASMGASLAELICTAQKAISQTYSIGIGLAPCTIPAVAQPNFAIAPGTMELGIGHHGEPGLRVEKIKSAQEMAKQCLELIQQDMSASSAALRKGDEVVILVSGLGATPVMELYIFYDNIAKELLEQGVKIYHQYVGNYFTSLEMMGLSLTLMRLDEELKQCIDLECQSMGLTQFQR